MVRTEVRPETCGCGPGVRMPGGYHLVAAVSVTLHGDLRHHKDLYK